jgi:hypothetical protein
MQAKISGLVAVVLAFLFLGWGAAPALALYAPAQDEFTAWRDNNTINYQVIDPMDGSTRQDSWTLDPGDSTGWVLFPVCDGGIVAWISGIQDYNYPRAWIHYTVHVRIYDPGRGLWKGADYGQLGEPYSLIVKDGVVAWKQVDPSAPEPGDQKVYWVRYTTYEPGGGSWVLGQYEIITPPYSPIAPEVLLVQDGVVAWPNSPLNKNVDMYFRIFDPEINRWVGYDNKYIYSPELFNLDWIKIENATVHVRIGYNGTIGGADHYFGYWPDIQQWTVDSSTNAWASFVAQPASGFAPLRVCFWDRSFGVNGANWLWNFADGGTSNLRSPVHRFQTPWNYPIILTLPNYQGYDRVYDATVEVKPVPTFTGGILINGGDTYSISTLVSLALQFSSPSGAQMRFRNVLYPLSGPEWLNWEAYAPTKDWNFFLGEGSWPVTVQFKDSNGFLSPEYSDSIILDFTPPAVILTLDNGAATTRNPSVKVDWSASDAVGIAQMHYTSFDEGDSYYHWSLVNFSPPTLIYRPRPSTIKFSSKPGRKTVMVRFTDVAGNVTHTQASIELKKVSLPFLQLLLD